MFITNQDYLNDEYVAMTRSYFIQYTEQAIPEFCDTLIQHLESVKKSIDERVQLKREYDSCVNERQMQTTEEKVDTSKALGASLVDTESNRTKSKEQDTSSRSRNDAHDDDDADIRPIYDEEPMAEVQTTAKIDVFAIGQQHTKQPEFNNEGEVVQNAEECHDTYLLPAIITDNQIPEHSYQSLKSKNFCLRRNVAQSQKDFSRREAHCVNLELKYQNQVLKKGKQGQFLKEKSNEAKVKHDIDAIETINIKLEHKVAKLLKENETLKKNYKELFDSIKITRAKTIEHTTSLTVTNDKFKAQLQEKGFAIAALKINNVENVFNQGRISVDMDQDKGIEILVDHEKDVEVPAQDDVDQENVTEEIADDVAQPTSPLPPSPVIPSSPPHQSPRPPPPQAVEGSSLLVQQVLDRCSALVLRIKGLETANTAQQLEILKLKARVKKLERLNKVKSSKLRRLKKVGTSQRIESSEDLKNVFNQERISVDIDEGIELVEKVAEIKGRQADTQAEIYNIDLDHSSKVLSMQEDDAEVQEAVEIVTTTKLMTEVVTAAATQVVASSTPIPAAKPAVVDVSTPINAAKPKVLKIVAAAPTVSTRKRKGSREEMEKEEHEIIKSINETPVQKAAKRRRLREQAKED
nr:hypothetical protein [Tanacetum cinerariifolium]